MEYKLLKYTPSLLACAAIYLTRKIANEIDWAREMQEMTSYGEKELRPVAKDLLKLIKGAKRSKLNAVVRKFSTSMYHYISKLDI